jgi:DNA-binding transcriptional LysR family regulator
MKYTLHQLEVFCKVVEKQSVTKAAEELFMTQPAVSIQLKNLQSQFKIPLTEVVGRKIFITEFGMKLKEKAEKILAQVEDVQHMALMYQGVLAGELKFSSASTGKYVMPFLLSGFSTNYPGVNLQLDVTNKTKVIESLTKNEIDFALVSVVPDHLEIEQLSLMENRLFIVGPTQQELPITRGPQLLESLPLIYREQGSATRQAMEDYIKHHELNITPSNELTSNEAVKQAILAGLGWSLMPIIGLKNEILNNEVQVIQLKGLPIVTEWNLIWLKKKTLSPAMKAYLKHIHKNRADIIQDKFNWSEKFRP